jgi:simple sugar transport system ATP-binding protein
MTQSPPPLFRLQNVTKRFGPVVANKGVTFGAYPNRIHALLGENGAGKSTLMSILSGRYQPDAGEMFLHEKPVTFRSPAKALAAGVGMVYQRFMLVENLTVLENIRLALPRSVSARDAKTRLGQLADAYGLSVDPDRRIRELSMGARQRVEILKLLLRDAALLIFDEPTAILTPPEVDAFFDVLRRLRADGKSIVFITHKLEEVLAVADDIAIMRRGRLTARLTPDQIPSKRELARQMVGREVVLRVDKAEIPVGETVLEARGLAGTGFSEVNLDLRRGQVTALVGVAGNGQENLSAALAGLQPFTAGTLRFRDRDIPAKDWAAAPHRRNATAYVPEDRYRVGSVGTMDLAENFGLTTLPRFCNGPLLDRDAMAQAAETAIADFAIAAPGTALPAGALSGGNLQKLILARELSREPDLFIAEQPTQGLDIAATEDIWKALLEQRRRSAVLLVTGDLKEALSLADRVAVMFRGRILDTVDARDAESVGRIGLLMAGVTD